MSYPTPLEQKRLANPGKRALPDEKSTIAIPAAVGVPEAPELGEKGLEQWQRVWTHCKGWISPATDLSLVIRYCELVDAYYACKQSVDSYGATYLSDGEPKVNPAVRQMDALSKTINAVERQLALTPVARAALGIAEIKQQSQLEKFLDRKQKRATVIDIEDVDTDD